MHACERFRDAPEQLCTWYFVLAYLRRGAQRSQLHLCRFTLYFWPEMPTSHLTEGRFFGESTTFGAYWTRELAGASQPFGVSAMTENPANTNESVWQATFSCSQARESLHSRKKGT